MSGSLLTSSLGVSAAVGGPLYVAERAVRQVAGSNEAMLRTGRCLCGHVRYELEGELPCSGGAVIALDSLCVDPNHLFVQSVPFFIRLVIPIDGTPITGNVEIRWYKQGEEKGYMAGVEFVNMSKEERASLNAVLDQL